MALLVQWAVEGDAAAIEALLARFRHSYVKRLPYEWTHVYKRDSTRQTLCKQCHDFRIDPKYFCLGYGSLHLRQEGTH